MLTGWWRRRRERRAGHEASMRHLRDEYVTKLEARDPDALEAARDYGDHDLETRRTQVGFGLALIVLMVSVIVLVAFSLAIKQIVAS